MISQIRAVAYYRMSSMKQECSIDQQRAEVEEYAASNGYRIIRWKPYIDEGISGSESERRPGFQQLIADATTKQDFEVILCWDQDRFSRFDPLEASHYWYLLRQAGVRIITVKQGEIDFKDLGGFIAAAVSQHAKSQYLPDLSRNVLRGRIAKAREGKYTGGRPPYGYRRTPDGEVILGDDECVDTVKRIFREYVTLDTSLSSIARRLNDEAIPAPRGGTWSQGIVQRIIRHDAYTGVLYQFRYTKGKYYTVSEDRIVEAAPGRPTEKPENEWQSIPCPQIVDDETWQAAQAKLVRRRGRTSPKSTSDRALLSGLMYCGDCGRRMVACQVRKSTKRDITDLIYVCGGYNRNGTDGCYRNPIHQAALLDFLIPKIKECVLSEDNYERLRAAVGRRVARRRRDGSPDTKPMRKRLEKLDREVRAAVAELKRTPDDLYDLAVADLRELRSKRDKLAEKVQAAETTPEARSGDEDSEAARILAHFERLREGLTDANVEVARECFHRIIDRIDLCFDHDHLKITRNYFRKGLVKFNSYNSLSPAIQPC